MPPERRVQRIGDPPCTLRCIVDTERAHRDAVIKCLALDVLHQQKVRGVLVADIVQRADAEMVQTANGLGFTTGAGQPVWITGEMFGRTSLLISIVELPR